MCEQWHVLLLNKESFTDIIFNLYTEYSKEILKDIDIYSEISLHKCVLIQKLKNSNVLFRSVELCIILTEKNLHLVKFDMYVFIY